MDLAYISHCVPDAPDKGEKIRAYHEFRHLAARHRVHLVCFARTRAEVEAARRLGTHCASLYVERLHPGLALARAALHFAAGGCLTAAFYASPGMHRRVRELAAHAHLSAALVYSSAMAPYAPAGVPLVLDMCDVDSEKFSQYARMRRPGFLYAAEARRLRELEAASAARARCTILIAEPEKEILQNIAPGARIMYLENGVDSDFFDPARVPPLSALEGRSFLIFTGALHYYPNAEAADWFARRVFPELRRRHPALEFVIAGRTPVNSVRRLAALDGVTVVANPPDVRPYLAAAAAVVAPLRLARGLQNKVLEALAMGKRVFAAPAVCRTFGKRLPAGVTACGSESAFVESILRQPLVPAAFDAAIRQDCCGRFSWPRTLDLLSAELAEAASGPASIAAAS